MQTTKSCHVQYLVPSFSVFLTEPPCKRLMFLAFFIGLVTRESQNSVTSNFQLFWGWDEKWPSYPRAPPPRKFSGGHFGCSVSSKNVKTESILIKNTTPPQKKKQLWSFWRSMSSKSVKNERILIKNDSFEKRFWWFWTLSWLQTRETQESNIIKDDFREEVRFNQNSLVFLRFYCSLGVKNGQNCFFGGGIFHQNSPVLWGLFSLRERQKWPKTLLFWRGSFLIKNRFFSFLLLQITKNAFVFFLGGGQF